MTLRVAFQSVEEDNEFASIRRVIDPIEIDEIVIWRVPTLAPIRNRITSRQPACVNGLQMPAGQPPRRPVPGMIIFTRRELHLLRNTHISVILKQNPKSEARNPKETKTTKS